jgi:hypothetical protein
MARHNPPWHVALFGCVIGLVLGVALNGNPFKPKPLTPEEQQRIAANRKLLEEVQPFDIIEVTPFGRDCTDAFYLVTHVFRDANQQVDSFNLRSGLYTEVTYEKQVRELAPSFVTRYPFDNPFYKDGLRMWFNPSERHLRSGAPASCSKK